MTCPHCGADAPDTWKFCGSCGKSLVEVSCPGCQFANPLGNRFCGNCGTALPDPAAAAPPPAPTRYPGVQDRGTALQDRYQVPERRQMTVMFCDLVGSTALSVRTDPEDLREVIRRFQDSCVPVINRFAGEVSRFMGDGILVYFGYPQAHEDDAERAVHAGLEILSNVAAMGPQPITSPPFIPEVRVGVATGLVVVGDIIGEGSAEEEAVVGETPNLAARLQSLATPGSVLISPTTRRLVGRAFEFEDLGHHELKGFTEPVAVSRVVRPSRIESRFDAANAGELLELIGRDEEMDLLSRRWERARSGEGQVVLLAGEAGIGKSRMTEELQSRVASETHLRLRYQCSPYHTHSALYPIITSLTRAIGADEIGTDEERLEALIAFVEPWCDGLDEAIPLLAELLSIAADERFPSLALTPQQKKDRTLDTLLEFLDARAREMPVLLLFEDVHWIDPTSQELLDALVARCDDQRLLAVVTFRPEEYSVPWGRLSQVTLVSLSRLNRRHGMELTARAAARGFLSEEMIEQIVQRTDGVPLYIEEIVKMIAETTGALSDDATGSGSDPLSAFSIPSSLRDALEARLDHLGRAKEVAQFCAALGRSFSYELIHGAASFEASFLDESLERMVKAELLFRRGQIFTFKHALIQEAAYGSLLRTKRQEFHRRIAEALVNPEQDKAGSQPEVLAHHYSNAGQYREAVEQWHQAAKIALNQSANVEAQAHLRKGLEDVQALPEGERDESALRLKFVLGSALTALKGYASPEVEQNYVEARELSQRIGDQNGLFLALRGLQSCYLVRGPLSTARVMSDELLTLADASADRTHIVEANRRLGWCQFCLGDMRSGRTHLLRAIEIYDQERSGEHIVGYGADPKVIAHANLAWLEWIQGRPDEALRHSQEAIDHGHRIEHSFSLAYALCMSAAVQQSLGDAQAARRLAHEVVLLANSKGFAYWTAWGNVIEAWAESETDLSEAALERLRSGIESYRETGSELFRPYNLYLLAEACTRSGLFDEAMNLLDEANVEAGNTEVAFYQAEILRLRGHLLEACGNADDRAVNEYRSAIELSKAQGALAVERRATLGLCQLLCKLKRGDEARPLLDSLLAGIPTEPSQELDAARELRASLART